MDTVELDARMMRLALVTARRGLGQTAPNPSVGAVLTHSETNEVLARAVTAPGGRPHAETRALAQAGAKAKGATLYVTLEPCAHQGQTPPCVDSIIAAGIGRVVVGMLDPDPRVAGAGVSRLRAAGIKVQTDVAAESAAWLTRGHALRMTQNRPFVQLKLALTAEGAVLKGRDGAPTWVTNALSRAVAHQLRAETDAILIGGQTLRADDPELTCRLPGLADRSPIRVVVTSRPSDIAGTELFATQDAAPVWLAFDDGTGQHIHPLTSGGAVPNQAAEKDLLADDLLAGLAESGVTRLLVEGGPTTWRWFAKSGLVDEVIAFIGAFNGRDAGGLERATALVSAQLERDTGAPVTSRMFGNDVCVTFQPRWVI